MNPLANINATSTGMWDRYEVGQLPNPFFTAANQFVPRSFHDVIKWSRYITTQSPTTTEVIRKLSSYPITELQVDPEAEPEVKDKYEKIFKQLRLIRKLCDIGFDYYTLGNVYLSIYFPIDRQLVCPNCRTGYGVRTAMDSGAARWKQYRFEGICPHCQTAVTYKRVDTISRDLSRINLVKWKPENISINHNPVTDESEYYYNIPGDVRKGIMLGNPLFLSTVPWSMVEAVQQNKEYLFDSSNFFHMKSVSMGSMLDGFGIPTLISHYNLVFYQAMLRRANEAVAAEHMTPLRAIFPQQNSGQGDPVQMLSLQGFAQHMKKTFRQLKSDPNHVLISPVPIGFQSIGGQGRALLVNQELQYAEEQQLMSLGVSRELLSGSTNWTSSTVGLRLLENTMGNYVSLILEVIEWVMRMVTGYLDIEQHEVTLVPFKLTDNEALKQAMMEMWKSQLVSAQTLLKAFGLDYNEELQNIKEDSISKAEVNIEVKDAVQRAAYLKSKEVNSAEDKTGFKEAQSQAFQVASQITDMMHSGDPQQLQQAQAILTQLHSTQPELYELVEQLLGDNNGNESSGS